MASKKKRRWRRMISGWLHPFREPPKKKKDPTNFYAVIDRLMVPTIRSGEAARMEHVVEQLSDKTISRLNKITIMGLCRLFLQVGQLGVVERLISTYLSEPRRAALTLYFLEPLVELDRAGALKEGPLLEFCAQFRPASGLTVLNWLSKQYKPADEADQHNFLRFIIAPLRALSEDPGNLIDIRFSEEQRAALQEKIRSSLREERPLSLLRLGDGEAYPYPPPEVKEIEPAVFHKDDINFELSRTHWGVSPPPGNSREELITSFRQAVARCDILGLPAVYRIVRNMTSPYSRYGTRRNQRAFFRILGALGNYIPTGQKIFTEERCHRIRRAIDEPFLVELAAAARSVVLVSCWPEIQPKFSVKSTFVPVPASGMELFRVYTEVIERVCELARPGTLVLIGAGVPAKIIADRARQAGAVALDVGSLMDYMVGQKTRSIADLT
jgi:glycosyltransferase GT-like protein